MVLIKGMFRFLSITVHDGIGFGCVFHCVVFRNIKKAKNLIIY